MTFKTKFFFYIYLFCYIFSFYIFMFPTSMLITIPLFICVCVSKEWMKCFMEIWGRKYIVYSFMYLVAICSVCFLITFFYRQNDFSLLILLYTQIVHFICATFFFTFLTVKKISFDELCDGYINIFVVQTFIELIASSVKPIGNFIRFFNHYDPSIVVGLGSRVRGYALSAATTYHLSLIYGVAFIIYIKTILEVNKITYKKIIQGCLIVVGVFFAGRTGFVGMGLGGLYYLITFQTTLRKKLTAIRKLIIVIFCTISIVLAWAPENLRMLLVDNLIPYAFEFLYNRNDSGKMQTASTNELKEMWNKDFDDYEIVLGSGKYVDERGYYMKVDPGFLRHLLYGGIAFYFLLWCYHLFLNFPLKYYKRKDYFIFFIIFIYFCVMDFKGVTIAVNKFAFVTSLLFGYSYLFLPHHKGDAIYAE